MKKKMSIKKMKELERYALQTGKYAYAEKMRSQQSFPYNAFVFVWEVKDGQTQTALLKKEGGEKG
jgi:hypothetical protein